ncbi:MAG: hypothetical protein HY426_03975 [Candidatus Levybacteria bacterium]|nr:hypothetical protein [Candidatus Levybacteria bacterium]
MRAKLEELKQKLSSPKGKGIALLALLILIPFLIATTTVLDINKESAPTIPEGRYLYVKGYYFDRPKEFAFEFSDPVDEHQLGHYFSISPSIQGRIEKNGSDRKFKFVATSDVPENSFITITILAGLTSKNRKPFLEDYYMDFDNTVKQENIFSKDEISGKVMSFVSGKPVEITVKKHSKAREMTFNIYKSDNASLLNFLAYRVVEKGDNDYKYEQEDFIRTNIAHEKEKLLETRVIKDNSSLQKLTLQPGVYYLEATDGRKKIYGASFVVVSKSGVVLRQDDQKVILATLDADTGKKISESAEAVFYNLKDAPTRVGGASYNELERGFSSPFSQRIDAALVTIGNETVFIPLQIIYSLAEIKVYQDLEKEPRIFVYTERPIYKPGDRVFFRGIVRKDSDSLYKLPPPGTPVYLTTENYTNRDEPTRITALTDSKGVFYGDFTIAKDKKASTEYLSASLSPFGDSNYSIFSANYDVAEYVKPKYEIKVEKASGDYLRHEKPKFTITGKFFSGQPMAGAKVEYQAYSQDYYESEKMVYNKNFNINKFGGMCGGGFDFEYYGQPLGEAKEVELDQNGKAVVEAPLDPKALLSQKITLSAKKTDDAKNEIIGMDSSIRHAGAFNIFFIPSSDSYKPGDTAEVPFYAEELNGEKVVGKEFKYRFIEDSYSGSRSIEKEIASGHLRSDDNGKGIINFTIPQSPDDYRYVIVEGTDRFGNKVETKKSIYVTSKSASRYTWRSSYDTFLKITSSQNSFQLGQSISLTVNSPQDLDVLLTLERGRVYNPQIVHLQKGDNKISIPVTPELSPSITPVFSFFYNGAYYTEGLSLNVPAMHKLLNISVNPNKEEYKKGENALLTIKVKDASGNPIASELSMGIVDKAIYALRKNATPSVHSEFYYFRDRRTNASSSLTWVGSYGGGGGGGGDGGGDLFSKLVDTLYWNPNIVTDSSGEVTLSVPLGSSTTTWKALVIGSDEATDVGQADTEFLVK